MAINLFGYGSTTPWRGSSSQTLSDQAKLVVALCDTTRSSRVHLLGHSFGGAVALKSAAILGNKVDRLVLWEPSLFYVLAQYGRSDAYAEAYALRNYVKQYGSVGAWEVVAERFANYWGGESAWIMMSPSQRTAFVEAVPNNFHEWDAVIDEETPMSEWRRLQTQTLLVCSRDTNRPIREIADLFLEACPHWTYVEIPVGGHMAPLTHPEVVTQIVSSFFNNLETEREALIPFRKIK
jgi:pimeloyl-ACP methyl ester carboxylesterase